MYDLGIPKDKIGDSAQRVIDRGVELTKRHTHGLLTCCCSIPSAAPHPLSPPPHVPLFSLQEAEVESLETRIGLLLEGASGDVRTRWDALAETVPDASKTTTGGARTRSKSPAGGRTAGGASRIPVAGSEGHAAANRVRAAADASLLEGELRDVIVRLQAEVSGGECATRPC